MRKNDISVDSKTFDNLSFGRYIKDVNQHTKKKKKHLNFHFDKTVPDVANLNIFSAFS